MECFFERTSVEMILESQTDIKRKGKHIYLDLDDWTIWGSQFRSWLEDRYSVDVLSRFNASAEPTWISWLDEQQFNHDGIHRNSIDLFASELRKRYAGIKVFHATRLPDMVSVKEQGLRAWSEAELVALAHAAFDGVVQANDLEREIEASKPSHRGGLVYSFASLHHALGIHDANDGGKLPWFALHGGEFLQSVALHVGVVNYKEQQKALHAYILACNLTWEQLDEDVFNCLVEHVLSTVIICRLLDTANYRMSGSLECVATRYTIPPKNIEFFADVEHMKCRDDISPSEIPWTKFE
jgi:hypothetical protein